MMGLSSIFSTIHESFQTPDHILRPAGLDRREYCHCNRGGGEISRQKH